MPCNICNALWSSKLGGNLKIWVFIKRTGLKSINNVRYPSATNIVTILALHFKLQFFLYVIVTQTTGCFRLTYQRISANILYSMQLELVFKKEYVCKLPSKRLKHLRHILHKDTDLAHIFCQITDVAASDIWNSVTKLQIYNSYYINNKIQNNKRYSSTANI